MVDEAPGSTCGQQTGASQGIEVVRKRGPRHLDAAFDLVHALPLWTGADEQPENFEAIFLPEGSKLFDTPLHPDISSTIELYLEQEEPAEKDCTGARGFKDHFGTNTHRRHVAKKATQIAGGLGMATTRSGSKTRAREIMG